MKKRIISLLVAAIMVVTMLPTVIVPTMATDPVQTTHNVRVAVRSIVEDSADGDITWQSDPIPVTGIGTYKGTVNIDLAGGIENIVSLGIVTDILTLDNTLDCPFTADNYGWLICTFCQGIDLFNAAGQPRTGCTVQGGCDFSVGEPDPTVHESWENLATEIDSITINGNVQLESPFLNFFRRRDRGENDNVINFALMELWNGWHAPHNTLTPVTETATYWGATAFTLVGGAPITSVEVEFTVFDMTKIPELDPTTDNIDVNLVTVVDGQILRGSSFGITENGSGSVSLTLPANTVYLERLAILADGGTFCPILPFRSIARPAPEAWREGAHMVINSIEINGNVIGGTAPTTRWNRVETRTDPEGINSHLVGQPSNDGSFSPIQNYVDIQLWNSWFEDSRVLNGVQRMAVEGFDYGEDGFDPNSTEPIAFGVAAGVAMNTITVNFTISGIPEAALPPTCPVCGDEEPCGNDCDVVCAVCGDSDPCANFCGTGLVLESSRASGTLTINDALQILRYLVNLESAVATPGHGRNAALITAESQRTGNPGINDALQILRSLVNLESRVRKI
jgi:hypothetical protein